MSQQSSQIVQRVDKTTSTRKQIAEIKLQSGRWLQIWAQKYDGTPNPNFAAAIVGATCVWSEELKPVEKKPGYYKEPADLVIYPAYQTQQIPVPIPNVPPRPAPQPVQQPPRPRPQPAAPVTNPSTDREQKIKEMADRRDALMERHIAALERCTAAIERLAQTMENFNVRPPSQEYPDYADLNMLTESDLANQPTDQPDPRDLSNDEPGY